MSCIGCADACATSSLIDIIVVVVYDLRARPQPRTRLFNVCDNFYIRDGFRPLPWSRIERELSVRDNDKYVDVKEHGFPLCRQQTITCVERPEEAFACVTSEGLKPMLRQPDHDACGALEKSCDVKIERAKRHWSVGGVKRRINAEKRKAWSLFYLAHQSPFDDVVVHSYSFFIVASLVGVIVIVIVDIKLDFSQLDSSQLNPHDPLPSQFKPYVSKSQHLTDFVQSEFGVADDFD
ncbi:hypothetical protein K443DRAFT_121180 [Laccaria amethystina LaAM-08-1]|uniref:Uncharacterized protein n=1 Tax=Laccaria amethystina LaAM-08-1 TaxID=1095629 RepID=A0A0C9Y7D5_9AGAR|nr:hypothetical protein K443DRAFT_121180 [Laccaria amethystina LaAM-08-1]